MDINCPSSNDSSKNEDSPQQQEKILSSGIQLRTSARVSKKLRLDQEANAAALAAANDGVKKEGKEDCDITEEKPKVRRAPVLWSPDDKAAFFEALNEHGKNFDAIEKYMLSRAKRRGDHSAKNRERARHFYYRTWHKISKHVHFPESIKKVTQELYALINFGELRKKVGYVTEKNAQKFNELIYSGCTQVRVRGKAWRVKTPVCRALRKLNQFEDDCEEVRLPSRIEVLITPRTNKDLARVQGLAHNPRVRTSLTLDTPVDNLREFLQARWWSNDKEALKLGPKKEAVAVQASYKCGQVVTSSSVSLLAHEQRVGGNEAYERVKALLSQLQIGKTKSMLKWQRDGGSVKDPRCNTDVVDPNHFPIDDNQQLPCEERASLRTRIGQLYIAYGSKGILELEYWWEDQFKEEESEFSKSLQKLVSIAKLYHLKIKVECPCGHVCKNNIKVTPNVQTKTTKQIKATKAVSVKQEVVSVSGEKKLLGFKQPLLPAPITNSQRSDNNNTAQNDPFSTLQALRSKYCHRRGRHRQRSVVVQRMLPLLPKTTLPLVVAVQTVPPTPTCHPKIINQTPTPNVNPNSTECGNEFLGQQSQISGQTQGIPTVVGTLLQPSVANPNSTECGNEFLGQQPHISGQNQGNPTVVGTLLQPLEEIVPPANSEPELEVKHLPEVKEEVMLPGTSNTFRGILGGSDRIDSVLDSTEMMEDTPPTSPTTLLKEEGQWLNSEVADFSLSSFLGHLESPLKTNGVTTTEDTHMSTDVESHFQSLMAESSLDYSAKFADLAKIIGNSAIPNPLTDPP